MNEQQQPPDGISLEPQEAITRQINQLVFKRAPDFLVAYVNNVSFSSSVWDVTMILGRIVVDNPHEPYIEQRASVTLSFQMAKAVVDALTTSIRNHEQRFGEIRYTPLSGQSDQPSS